MPVPVSELALAPCTFEISPRLHPAPMLPPVHCVTGAATTGTLYSGRAGKSAAKAACPSSTLKAAIAMNDVAERRINQSPSYRQRDTAPQIWGGCRGLATLGYLLSKLGCAT